MVKAVFANLVGVAVASCGNVNIGIHGSDRAHQHTVSDSCECGYKCCADGSRDWVYYPETDNTCYCQDGTGQVEFVAKGAYSGSCSSLKGSVSGSAAGTLGVTWSDCGATHAVVTDLQPASFETGSSAKLCGTGTLDEDLASAHFSTTVSAKGVQLTSCEGDGATDITCKLPLGAGSITLNHKDFPIKAGPVQVCVDVTTSSIIPPSLAEVDVHIDAVDPNGETVICLDVHTKKAELEDSASCSGTADFVETPACYGNNVMGQEDVTMKIESFASGAGRLSVEGTGATPLSCETAFTKDGSNNIAIEDCDVSSYATIKGAQYCSDTDELKATFNPLGVPIPVSVKFPRKACASEDITV